ncbi:DUF6428 family protein [Parapedobacter tibetensis]|uniref:DUF6428 family protein n=1 Tax=Parapedobacter tibetensis TaxID=2972951 RepID=UPI00214DF041|nr:DUF6428 family protein [Parapedobacter tibetensis]
MNNMDLMTWGTFKEKLTAHPYMVLQFQYAEGHWVDASYHITEIKQAPITSVDCGGVLNAWTEIIVQLWEPAGKEQSRAMEVSKALAIVGVVEKSLPLNPSAIVKIEFGNSQFDTRQMFPGEFIQEGENLVVNLIPDATQCKAIGRGGSCGTTAAGKECCEDSVTQPKKKVEMVKLATVEVCEPGSGCC